MGFILGKGSFGTHHVDGGWNCFGRAMTLGSLVEISRGLSPKGSFAQKKSPDGVMFIILYTDYGGVVERGGEGVVERGGWGGIGCEVEIFSWGGVVRSNVVGDIFRRSIRTRIFYPPSI